MMEEDEDGVLLLFPFANLHKIHLLLTCLYFDLHSSGVRVGACVFL